MFAWSAQDAAAVDPAVPGMIQLPKSELRNRNIGTILILHVGYATIITATYLQESVLMVLYNMSKRKKGVKYGVMEPEEFWTKERLERARRRLEPVPNSEVYLRFMRERMGPELEKIRAQRAKHREQEAKLAGPKDPKPV